MAKQRGMAVPAGQLEQPEHEFRIGQKVTVRIDWGNGLHRNKRFQISGFQMNGHVLHATGFWLGKNAKQLDEEYGKIFPVLDLKPLDKS